MDDIWRDALLYNKWANLVVLDHCGTLSQEQLELSAPGTYGTIVDTLMHLLGAEQRYLRRLTGAQPTLSEKDQFPGIAKLREHAVESGDALLAAAAKLTPDDTTEARYDELGKVVKLRQSLIVVQAIHHGNDHRTHIGTILGQNDISYGDLDVWAFGESNDGYVKC